MWVCSLFLFLVPMYSAIAYYTSVNGGSYNSLLHQVGYCKAQSFETISRNTSSSPSIFQKGKVLFGVGLSHVQFQRSIVSCGQCIQVLTVDRFYHFNTELTAWNYQKPHKGNFTVMVFDECTDPICESGFLDFDIYHERQPVAYGNPTDLTWQFVPCPVGIGDTIEFLFCMGYESCREQDLEGRSIQEMHDNAFHENWLTVYPRNFRVAITQVYIQGEPLEDNQAWVWTSMDYQKLKPLEWLVEWTNQDGTTQSWTLDWSVHLTNKTTFGYRGGIVVHTQQQN